MIKTFFDKLMGKKPTAAAKKPKFGKRIEIPVSEHGIDPHLVDERALHVVGTLQQAGFEAYIVGGGVVHVGAEGGDFDDFVFAAPAVDHVDDAKAPPDDEGAAEQALDLLGRGVGGHVEVFGAQADQQVAHGAADDVGLEAGVLQGRADLDGALVHQAGVNAVVLGGTWGLARVFAQDLVYQSLDHENSRRMRQPRSKATASRAELGLVATGSLAKSSKGRSLGESL